MLVVGDSFVGGMGKSKNRLLAADKQTTHVLAIS